jgi:hypothetical protein
MNVDCDGHVADAKRRAVVCFSARDASGTRRIATCLPDDWSVECALRLSYFSASQGGLSIELDRVAIFHQI